MMKLAILLVADVIVRQACGDAPEAIVGGNMATIGQFPHQVSLQLRDPDRFHYCGGSIISSTHILTAAHCIDEEREQNDAVVVTGNIKYKEGSKHQIKNYTIHPKYPYGKPHNDDIAIITLAEPIIFNKNQRPIPLASRNYATGQYRGIISGWGYVIDIPKNLEFRHPEWVVSPWLKWLQVNVLSDEECQRMKGNTPITKAEICVLDKIGSGACDGDSGGPLVVNGELCGVASFVSSAGCAKGTPDTYTNVYHYKNWISEHQKMNP